ncbi:MAG: hypothetical protein SOW08_10575 [Lachnospiraceae bacterium]|nr:hypothetical protein [Lachnospiraceae bacterium]
MENKIGRPCTKTYDTAAVMEELLSTVDSVFEEKQEIRATAQELDLAELKVRKLLITSGKIHYAVTDRIQELQRKGKKMEEIQDILDLSKASINAYLPYSRNPYKQSEVSANAKRCELYRLRKAAVEKICDGETLWDALLLFQSYTFYTVTGLQFSYEIRKGRSGDYTKELWIDRRGESKSLTMSTVLKAYENRIGAGIVDRPKALGDLRGVSYIYPIFFRFGLIEVPEKVKDVLRGKKK